MEMHKRFDLFDCPRCQGPALLEEENGWCYYVTCCDCGCHTAEVAFDSEEERIDAAGRAVMLWNNGKVLASEPGE